MDVLILGGNSKRHCEWIRRLGVTLGSAGYTVILHDYRHWQTGKPLADIEHALEKIDNVTVMQNQDDPYGSAEYVLYRLQAIPMKSMQFITLEDNNTHDYLDFEFIETKIR